MLRDNLTDYSIEELVKAVELYEDLMNGRLQENICREISEATKK